MTTGLWERWADEFFGTVMPAEADAKARYLHLVAVTERYLHRHRQETMTLELLDPVTAGNHLGWKFDVGEARCKRLSERWWAWDRDVTAILERYPHLALREAISEVSERSMGDRWPYAYDDLLLQWIDGGDYDSNPDGVRASRDLFYRLVDLRRGAGGWWHWHRSLERAVWCPDADRGGC